MSLIVIEAGKSERGYWRDIWRFRELFFFLSWRDILVRYKQTVIGVLWAVIRPFLTMLVLTFAFSKLANMPSDGLPYPVMVFAAMLPWLFFSSAMSEASNSLITNANMLSKIYFPRLIVPASAVIVSFADFLISLVIMAGLMAWYVKYRDFRYVVPFIVQFGLYLTPVGFPSEVVRQKYGAVAYHFYALNPMVGVINGFRWAVGGSAHVRMDWNSLLVSILVVLVIAVSGLRYFRATEENFADII
jgi:lipopolysaccharide transport system permease protein